MHISKTIAFGDVHGCYLALQTAIQLAENKKARAVFLGDYVDRGPDSLKTLVLLIEAKKKHPNWVFLRGNHDQMLLDLIHGKTPPDTEFEVICGRTSNMETSKVYSMWKSVSESVKNNITEFLNQTLFYFETEQRIFVHATLKDSTVQLRDKPIEELIWNYERDPTWIGKQFVHGHATVEVPTKHDNGININTLCGYGGVLTAMLITTIFDQIANQDVSEQIDFFFDFRNGYTIKY